MTEQNEDQLAVVLGQRQLIAVCCMFLMVIVLVSTLSYVTGRSITAAQMRNADASMSTPPIIVDPVRSATTSPAPLEARAQRAMPTGSPIAQRRMPDKPSPFTPQAAPPVMQAMASTTPPPAIRSQPAPQPVAAPAVTPSPVQASAAGLYQPQPGQLFWQVGIVELRLADSFTGQLKVLGLEAHQTIANSDDGRKILIGPLANDAQAESVREVLAANRYQHFLKRF